MTDQRTNQPDIIEPSHVRLLRRAAAHKAGGTTRNDRVRKMIAK